MEWTAAPGREGEVITHFPRDERDWVATTPVQLGGKFVATGDTVGDSGIVRYEPNGIRDFWLGDDASLAANIFGRLWGAILPGGAIVVVGSWRDLADPRLDRAATRFPSDGTLDTAFGEDGRARVDSEGLCDSAYAGAIEDDGAILLGGEIRYCHGASTSRPSG